MAANGAVQEIRVRRLALIGLWLRVERRRSLGSLIAIAVLVALSAGCILAAVAGARRADSALSRLATATAPADLLVAPASNDPDLAAVAALPEVAAADSGTEFGLTFAGIPVASGRAGSLATMILPYGDQLLRGVERPVVMSGRLPDPSRADEAAVTSGFVTSFGRGVGDVLRPGLAAGVEPIGDPGLLPKAVRIVGVIRSPLFSDDATTKGRIVLTPALGAIFRQIYPQAYAAEIVRLRHGHADLASFTRHLQALRGGATASVLDSAETTHRRQHVVSFETRFLLAAAGCLLLAALVLVGQAVARVAAGSVGQLRALRGLGMTRRQIVGLAVSGPVLAGATGGIAGTLIAWATSWVFPLGSAAGYETDPGLHADLLILGSGLLLTPVVTAVLAVTGAWFALISGDRAPVSARRSSVLEGMARLRMPVPVVLGTRFALEPGTGTHAVPARSAQLGAVAGVLGVTAALTFAAGVAEVASNPARFGQTFQLSVPLSAGARPAQETDRNVLAVLARDPDVVAVNDSASGGGTLLRPGAPSGTDLVLNRYRPSAGQPAVVLLSGRLPTAPDEAVLGPESAQAADVVPGDRITMRGSGGQRDLTVTGLGLVPESWRGSYAEGAWLTSAGYAGIVAGDDGEHSAFVTVRSGVSRQDVAHRLDLAVSRAAGFDPQSPPPDRMYQVEIEHQPARAGEVSRVRPYPVVLGGLLALLALAASGHALISVVRRRGKEFAVLRAAGMTPRQSGLVVLSQSGVLALVGLAFGTPLGLGLGRILWRAVAEYTPVQYAPPAPWPVLLVVVPAAGALSVLLAAWPGHQASHLRLATLLRTE